MMRRAFFFISIFSCLMIFNLEVSSQENVDEGLLITSQDRVVIKKTFGEFKTQQDLPMGELITAIGKSFLKVPYVPQTLETGDTEIMVINVRQFDCTTFAENCLAFARCIKLDKPVVSEFISELKNIRYRNGELDGYCSRLHYFSDWIFDNEQKGLITLPKDLQSDVFPNSVDFMSTHPDSYPALYEDPRLISQIADLEQSISNNKYSFLPKTKIKEFESQLKEGDIIGITTNIPGLDIAHVGIITFKNERAHLLHASLSMKRVVFSDKPLYDFLLPKKSFTGIMVARPVE